MKGKIAWVVENKFNLFVELFTLQPNRYYYNDKDYTVTKIVYLEVEE